ncbi:MAG: hypothetical protein KatS3mg105_4188 [Gemmatales bacterium]|nr:MAG: hypothetical protein KatS3mg105_4188 [Gemmatales bacterium]
MATDGDKKFFTVAEANKMLPLVRAIVTDISNLAGDLRDRYQRLVRVQAEQDCLSSEYREEVQQVLEQFERDQERMREYEKELSSLGVLLKDYHTGLVDFPCWKDNREVYLCWRLGEPAVAFWHEVEAGFAGRQRIQPESDMVPQN